MGLAVCLVRLVVHDFLPVAPVFGKMGLYGFDRNVVRMGYHISARGIVFQIPDLGFDPGIDMGDLSVYVVGYFRLVES